MDVVVSPRSQSELLRNRRSESAQIVRVYAEQVRQTEAAQTFALRRAAESSSVFNFKQNGATTVAAVGGRVVSADAIAAHHPAVPLLHLPAHLPVASGLTSPTSLSARKPMLPDRARRERPLSANITHSARGRATPQTDFFYKSFAKPPPEIPSSGCSVSSGSMRSSRSSSRQTAAAAMTLTALQALTRADTLSLLAKAQRLRGRDDAGRVVLELVPSPRGKEAAACSGGSAAAAAVNDAAAAALGTSSSSPRRCAGSCVPTAQSPSSRVDIAAVPVVCGMPARYGPGPPLAPTSSLAVAMGIMQGRPVPPAPLALLAPPPQMLRFHLARYGSNASAVSQRATPRCVSIDDTAFMAAAAAGGAAAADGGLLMPPAFQLSAAPPTGGTATPQPAAAAAMARPASGAGKRVVASLAMAVSVYCAAPGETSISP